MKKLLTIAFAFSIFFVGNVTNAQSLTEQADSQTKAMASKLKLNEGEYLKLKQLNIVRLEKIEALKDLREQDERYLDIRLDQIEEEYSSMLFNTLDEKQFKAYASYRKDQPYTYAGVVNKNNALKNSAIAIAAE